jgi:hypothetical protein
MEFNNLGNAQINLLNLAKSYLEKKSNSNSPFYYLNIWSRDSLGSLNFEYVQKTNIYTFFKKYLSLIKCIAETRHIYKYEFYNNTKNYSASCIVVSWSKKENFLDDGSFYCPYYGVNSKESPNSIIWLLVSLDNFIPDNLNTNIYIFYREYKGYSIKEIIKNLGNWFKEGVLPITQAIFLKNFTSIFLTRVMHKSIKSILIPYEAQPWQHAIYEITKRISENIKNVGYVHSSLPPLPLDYIKRKGAPDILLVHGKGQKEILYKYLGWDRNSIKVIDSMRYKKNSQNLQDKIFIPYDFFNTKNYLKFFEEILKNKKVTLPTLSIKNHPLKINSSKHLKFIELIEEILINYKSNFKSSLDSRVSVVFGITTCVLDCLSQDINVLHIVDNPVYESYSNAIWNGITVTRLTDNAFLYQQKDKELYLQITGYKIFQEEILNYV